MFLPINSIEKYLYQKLVDSPDVGIKKQINDRFFQIESLDSLIAEYTKMEEENKKSVIG